MNESRKSNCLLALVLCCKPGLCLALLLLFPDFIECRTLRKYNVKKINALLNGWTIIWHLRRMLFTIVLDPMECISAKYMRITMDEYDDDDNGIRYA